MVSKVLGKAKAAFVVVCLLLAIGGSRAAAIASQPHGITVSPAIEKIVLKPDQNTATFTTTVTNNTPTPEAITVVARDFTASSNGKQLTFIGNNTTETSNLHGLSKSMQIGLSQFALAPGKTQKIPVSIVNANTLVPGGHYAAIVFNVRGLSGSQSNTVGVHEAVSSLVFADTSGGGTETTTLAALPLSWVVTSLPQSINTVLTNDGNTETVPRGYAQIVGPSGQVVAQGIINADSGMILPGSSRLFPVTLVQAGSHSLIGTYHLKVFYRHDGQATYSVYDKQFLLINVPIIIITTVLLVLLVVLLVWFVKSKLAKRVRQKQSKPKTIKVVVK